MISYTQLIGTTASNSPILYGQSFTTLSQNNSPQNVSFGQAQINNEQRYLLQKYFDNERTVTTTTVGSQNLTTTTSISAGATTATLTSSWTLPTGNSYVNFSDSEQRYVLFTNGSAAISWSGALTGNVTSAISMLGFQEYNIPANVSKMKNDTINVGQLKFQTIPVMSRAEWDQINFLPYNSDIPMYNFIYNGKLGIFPIPSTTGNILTFNYKTRIADLSYADTTGFLATMAVGSTAVTGTATTWNTQYPIGVDISYQNLYIKADVATGGDGIWYPIRQFNSATSLTLNLPVINAPSITTSTAFIIGQFPILSEDFQDMLVLKALVRYYSTIVDNETKRRAFEEEYDRKLVLLEEYAGTKQVNLDLEGIPNQINPNLFIYGR